MPITPRFTPKRPTSAGSTSAVRRIPTRRIEILACPRVQLLDVTGPLQVFATANELAPRGSRRLSSYGR